MHNPKFIPGKDEKTILIFIHGFLSGPGHFADLLEVAGKEGFAAASLLLPGHGGSGQDFFKATLTDWQQYLQTELKKYRHYEQIFLVGHSIGGLLALMAAIDESSPISGVVLLAAPLKVYFINPFSLFRKLCILLRSDLRKVYQKACSIKGLFPWLLLSIRALCQPHKLMRHTRKILKEVKVPSLLIYSKKDEITHSRSLHLLTEGLINSRQEIIILNDSLHVFYTLKERRYLSNKILGFIKLNF